MKLMKKLKYQNFTTMKICAISDIHGDLPDKDSFEKCELILISGDFSPLNIQTKIQLMREWLIQVFTPWCESLPCNKVYFIAGNHDFIAKKDPDFMTMYFSEDEKATYLYQETSIYKSEEGKEYKIFGTPWCQVFGNWPFMADKDTLINLYSAIPYDIDILLTHDQPYGYGDILLQKTKWSTDNHIGNKPLAEAVILKQPKYLFCGHLHSTSHDCVSILNTKRYNVSLKDEYYDMVYKPLYLDI